MSFVHKGTQQHHYFYSHYITLRREQSLQAMSFFAFKEATMTEIRPTIRLLTLQEAEQSRLHSRGLILEYEAKSYRLNSGTSDQIHVFTRSIYLFVLSINRSLG